MATTEFENSKICVLGGAGYVGLITGVGFAMLGYDVVCADINAARIKKLAKGEPPIHEEHLPQILAKLIQTQKIEFTTDIDSAIAEANIIVIAVGTPALKGGTPDVSQAIEAVETIVRNLNSSKLLIVKSTLPVGIRDKFGEIIQSKLNSNAQVEIVFNPEFLREGSGIADFFHCERIVVGSHSPKALKQIADLYKPLLGGDFELDFGLKKPTRKPQYIETDPTSAQLIKYASNAHLAMRVSYVNELADLVERLGGDVSLVLKAVGMDSRIGNAYLEPGPGFGGPCLEKDISALINLAENSDYNPVLLKGALERNNLRLNSIMNDLQELTGKLFNDLVVCVFGIAFKSGTNDARTSLSIRLMEHLNQVGAMIVATDPLVSAAQLQTRIPQAKYEADAITAAQGADVVVVMNNDPAYTELDYAKIATAKTKPLIYDTRHCLDAERVRAAGLSYATIGSKLRYG